MKWIGIFSILIFILVRKIYSTNLCFPEKYKKYETMFTNAFKAVTNEPILLNYSYYQMMDDYVKSFSLYKCDVAMVEPALYDEHYDSIEDISELIVGDIEARTSDEVDGEIYQELLKDLRVDIDNRKSDKVVIKALPLFMDYGILYYRSDIDQNPPKTWTELSSITNWLYDINFRLTDTVYIGQFNEYREFFYNLIENVLNTETEPLTYKVIEQETNYTIGQFKELFDSEIIDEYAWHLNSEYGVIRFTDEKAIYMRNWSSFLYNVTTEFNKKQPDENGVKKSFGYTKMLYSEGRSTGSRAINKGIYICVAGDPDGKKRVDVPTATIVAQTFSSKEFMKLLLEYDEFYDIPAYHSLILEDDASINNRKYCERINCEFFRELAENQIVATYDVFYQNEFLQKLLEFFEKAKSFFKEAGGEEDNSSSKDSISLETLMSLFSDYFQDKYVELGSPTTIIMIAIVAIEIAITSVVTYYLIKYRNFIEIRRSSPLFLITMLFGIILAFGSILTYIGKPNKFICIFRPYILVLTFGLTFFSLLLKTFRIKVIFDKVNIQVKDSNLILYLCILLGFELILVTVWSFVAGMEPEVKMVSKEMHYYICRNTDKVGEIIQTSLIVINGLALVYGCYLAYKVKNVYSEYNESKVIGLSIYGIVICMIILMFIVNINGLDHTTLFLIQSLMIILSADIILVFMFTPKLWKLHINILSEMSSYDNNNNKPPQQQSSERKAASAQQDDDKNMSLKNSTLHTNNEQQM